MHRQFFQQFVIYGSTVLYKKYVVKPKTKEELFFIYERIANETVIEQFQQLLYFNGN